MRENRSSGSVEGVMGNHDSYSDSVDKRELVGLEQHLRIARPEIQRLRHRACEIVLGVPGPLAAFYYRGPHKRIIFGIEPRVDDKTDGVAFLNLDSGELCLRARSVHPPGSQLTL